MIAEVQEICAEGDQRVSKAITAVNNVSTVQFIWTDID